MPLFTRSDLRELGTTARRLVLARVGQGIGSDGRKFKRLKTGGPATLRRTGRLLGSIGLTATDTAVEVAPTAAYAAHVERDRPFIAPSARDQEAVDADFLRLLDAREREMDRGRRKR